MDANNRNNELLSRFALDLPVTKVSPLGEGFINDTFIVEGPDGPEYILQRKNKNVFPDVEAMMDNIARVTAYIRRFERVTLTIVPSRDGRLFYQDAEGEYWAVCKFIKGSLAYSVADSAELVRQGGLGLGNFHRCVKDFNEPLTEIIKGFHNIRWRFTQWDESVSKDAAGRVASLSEEISWIESRRQQMLDFWKLYETGVLPSRVIHGDTKISNFLFNKTDGSYLCAIDLDTLMRSTLLCDVGDALRAYTNTGREDEAELSKVSMSMDYFRAYISGYLGVMKPYLNEAELRYLAFSGIYITFEQVLRFLMDYIDGDVYYKTAYPDHNLVRTRAQYALLQSMESQLTEMEDFVRTF